MSGIKEGLGARTTSWRGHRVGDDAGHRGGSLGVQRAVRTGVSLLGLFSDTVGVTVTLQTVVPENSPLWPGPDWEASFWGM